MRFLVLFALFVATAPADGRYGFVNQYLGIPDDVYRMLRYIICIVGVATFFVQSRTSFLEFLRKYWLLWIIAAANFASMVFARDPDWSFRQATVATVTIVTAATCIEAFHGRATALMRLAGYTFIGSVLLVVLAPSVSTISPFLQSAGSVGEPGSWLGVFSSKNELGHASGILFAVVLIFGRALLPKPDLVAVSLACGICLIESKSASGIVLAAAACGLFLVLKVYQSRGNALLKLASAMPLLLAAIFSQEILDWGLSSLSKDSTLTGRTDIWSWGWLLVANNFPAGLGYGQTWTPGFVGEVSDIFSVMHLHNGFVEMLANNGVLGAIALAMFAYALMLGALALRSPHHGGDLQLWVIVLICWLTSAMTEPYVFRPSGFLPVIGYLALAGIVQIRHAQSRPPRYFPAMWPARASVPHP